MDVIALLGRYKYLSMFSVLLLCGIGLPVPEEFTLVGSGLAVGWERANFFLAGLACVLGILAGDSVIFALGRYYGRSFMTSRGTRWIFTKRRQARVRKLFSDHHSKTVVIARFLTGLRIVIYAYAGQHGMSWARFLVLDCLAGVIYAVLFIGFGWLCGQNIDPAEAEGFLKEVHTWVLIAVGVAVLGFVLLFWRWKHLHDMRLEELNAEKNGAAEKTESSVADDPEPIEAGREMTND